MKFGTFFKNYLKSTALLSLIQIGIGLMTLAGFGIAKAIQNRKAASEEVDEIFGYETSEE